MLIKVNLTNIIGNSFNAVCVIIFLRLGCTNLSFLKMIFLGIVFPRKMNHAARVVFGLKTFSIIWKLLLLPFVSDF